MRNRKTTKLSDKKGFVQERNYHEEDKQIIFAGCNLRHIHSCATDVCRRRWRTKHGNSEFRQCGPAAQRKHLWQKRFCQLPGRLVNRSTHT
jgi:hypothetical protein